MARTAAGLLEVVAAIGELEARVIAVARLVARALDNRVRRLLLNDAARVPALAAELRGAAASGGGPVNGQGYQRGDDDQPGQPGRVLPPHSPRDSATLTTLLSPPPTTTTTLVVGSGVETPRTRAATRRFTLLYELLVAHAIDRRHIDLKGSCVSRYRLPNPSERIALQV